MQLYPTQQPLWLVRGTLARVGTIAAVGAFLPEATTRDAAVLVSLAPGRYTAQVDGVGTAAGAALVEVYDVP